MEKNIALFDIEENIEEILEKDIPSEDVLGAKADEPILDSPEENINSYDKKLEELEEKNEKNEKAKPKNKKAKKQEGIITKVTSATTVVLDSNGHYFRLIGIRGQVGDKIEF